MAFNPLGLFLEVFFSLTSYLSGNKSDSHAPGLTKSIVLWIIFALLLGLWGSLHPFIAMKSSSFSLLDKEINNLGQTSSLSSFTLSIKTFASNPSDPLVV
uniref:Uncharacterized protein n=1 Tax=Rhizophora mucronata TaxID=61149 RepID=A0A2P2M6C5_RHIMU